MQELTANAPYDVTDFQPALGFVFAAEGTSANDFSNMVFEKVQGKIDLFRNYNKLGVGISNMGGNQFAYTVILALT